ncbi:hypothetical protein ABIC07_006863 [Bradyrhizobium sp. RT9a]
MHELAGVVPRGFQFSQRLLIEFVGGRMLRRPFRLYRLNRFNRVLHGGLDTFTSGCDLLEEIGLDLVELGDDGAVGKLLASGPTIEPSDAQ